MKIEELIAIAGIFFFLGIIFLMTYPAFKDFWRNLSHYFSRS